MANNASAARGGRPGNFRAPNDNPNRIAAMLVASGAAATAARAVGPNATSTIARIKEIIESNNMQSMAVEVASETAVDAVSGAAETLAETATEVAEAVVETATPVAVTVATEVKNTVVTSLPKIADVEAMLRLLLGLCNLSKDRINDCIELLKHLEESKIFEAAMTLANDFKENATSVAQTSKDVVLSTVHNGSTFVSETFSASISIVGQAFGANPLLLVGAGTGTVVALAALAVWYTRNQACDLQLPLESRTIWERTYQKTEQEVKKEAFEKMGIDTKNNFNVAVCGLTGVGKSSLINALRDVSNNAEGAAKVGAVECTTEFQVYPWWGKVRLYDLPGGFTRSETVKDYEIRYYLSCFHVIILAFDRWTEIDLQILGNLHAHGLTSRVFLTRTKTEGPLEDKIEEISSVEGAKNELRKEVRDKVESDVAKAISGLDMGQMEPIVFFGAKAYQKKKVNLLMDEKKLVGRIRAHWARYRTDFHT
ncbi:hypothetical protein M427DRAFT_158632 [Gonapodya prolifera JEL478]|uniref:IRG-type G domain-containing protein n=1 Tax=Gonapodya prolifera (strain JEL478) TaxID=1344416 RepID=A0A139A298_GONPJ|nr:hypothetical protein M427DRAFT_158632 [Gonapodya prolifera JEL478]|eukprot:KXS10916.1 hypothetical protein M427DRAFT_158632 [Gonapodya prolifera JEL478]